MMVVFYLINLAGAGDAGSALAGVHGRAGSLADKTGQTSTASAGKGWKWFASGQRDKAGNITSGGYISRIGKGIQGGWNKMWNK